MRIAVRQGQRVEGQLIQRTVHTVIVVIGGVQFTHDVDDETTARKLATETAQAIGREMGMEP